jgi:hypothetical protein
VGAGLRRRIPNRPSIALGGETGDAIEVPFEIQRRGRERPRIGLGVQTGDAGEILEIIAELVKVIPLGAAQLPIPNIDQVIPLGAEHVQVLPIPNLDHTQKSHQRKRLHDARFHCVGSEHVEFFTIIFGRILSPRNSQQLITVWV